mgnify:CR=1 FL=1
MKYSKRKAINDLASKLIEVLELTVPIDIERVPVILGGKIEYVSKPLENNMEAQIVNESTTFKITIYDDKPDVRKRFSIAHELGHLFLHMGYIINEDLWKKTLEYSDSVYYRHGYSVEELEANEFAAAFLMPEKQFKKCAYDSLDNGYYDLEIIAEQFKVSIQAVEVRGVKLGLW